MPNHHVMFHARRPSLIHVESFIQNFVQAHFLSVTLHCIAFHSLLAQQHKKKAHTHKVLYTTKAHHQGTPPRDSSIALLHRSAATMSYASVAGINNHCEYVSNPGGPELDAAFAANLINPTPTFETLFDMLPATVAVLPQSNPYPAGFVDDAYSRNFAETLPILDAPPSMEQHIGLAHISGPFGFVAGTQSVTMSQANLVLANDTPIPLVLAVPAVPLVMFDPPTRAVRLGQGSRPWDLSVMQIGINMGGTATDAFPADSLTESSNSKHVFICDNPISHLVMFYEDTSVQQGASTASIADATGNQLGQGLARYTSDEAEIIKGRRSGDIETALGYPGRAALIHRDDMVL